jgi:hypothetical protein
MSKRKIGGAPTTLADCPTVARPKIKKFGNTGAPRHAGYNLY